MRLFTLPNLITLGNLLCGLLGILALIQNNFMLASGYILIALVLDFLDGFVARLTKTYSDIGKQLDSLADMVTFGVLPSFMLYFLSGEAGYWKIICFLPALFSALRLAKFNIDERQALGFYGLPTPANAMTVASFPFVLSDKAPAFLFSYRTELILCYSVIISLLMISDLPMMALKFKNFSWTDNQFRFIFLILSALGLIWLKAFAIPAILLLYLLFSGLQAIKSR